MVVNTRFPKRFLLSILGIAIMVIIYYPIHEFGHWLIANIDGAEILEFHPFPRWENGLLNASTIVNKWTFSSIYSFILFILGGFLITFLPSSLLFIYFYKKESKIWVLPFTWVMLSPIASINDFVSMAIVTQNLNLDITLNLGVAIISIMLITWFIKNMKPIFRS